MSRDQGVMNAPAESHQKRDGPEWPGSQTHQA